MSTESLILGFPNRWASATFTATAEDAGGPASNLALPQHDAPWIVPLEGTTESVVIDASGPIDLNAIRIEGARTTGFAAADLRVRVETASDLGFTTDVTDWTGGTVPFRISAAVGAVPRLDMPQANVGPTDAELTAIMTLGRNSFTTRRAVGSEVSRRYARITISHVATPTAGQELSIAHVWGGWAWSPKLGTSSSRFGFVAEPNGRQLLSADVDLQAVASDALFARAWRQFFLVAGREARGWVWARPDRLEDYYERSFSGVFLPGDLTEGVGLVAPYGVPGDVARTNNTWPLRIVERFNMETAT